VFEITELEIIKFEYRLFIASFRSNFYVISFKLRLTGCALAPNLRLRQFYFDWMRGEL